MAVDDAVVDIVVVAVVDEEREDVVVVVVVPVVEVDFQIVSIGVAIVAFPT